MSKLHIDSVTKSYNNKVILSDVFISCRKNEIKGLVGRNGSGKSTLLKIVFGTEKADFKFVRVGEKIIRNISDCRNLINYLPQDNFLPNNIKVGTLIKLFLPKKTRDILFQNKHDLPLLNKKNQDLSGGEKRIIELQGEKLLYSNGSDKYELKPLSSKTLCYANYEDIRIDFINTDVFVISSCSVNPLTFKRKTQ